MKRSRQPEETRAAERQACVAFLQVLTQINSSLHPAAHNSLRVQEEDVENRSQLVPPQQARAGAMRDIEQPLITRIIEEANQVGHGRLHCQVYIKDPHNKPRSNLVVTLSSSSSPSSSNEEEDLIFLLVAHADTVPIGDATRWSHPPLSAHIDEATHIMYGRGTCDNKAGIAVALYTLKRLLTSLPPGAALPVRGKICLAVVADEESGANSEWGLRHLLDAGVIKSSKHSSFSSLCGGSIYTYPGRTVTLGHRGVLRVKIEIHGKSLHTGSIDWATKRRGANALTAVAEVITRIETEPWPRGCHPVFPNLPLTVTPTVCHGGVGESIVPEAASCLIDCRIPPTCIADEEEEETALPKMMTSDEVVERLEAIVKEVIERRNNNATAAAGRGEEEAVAGDLIAASLSVHVNIPPYHITHDHPLAQACIDAVQTITGKAPTQVRGAGPGNEGYMLGAAGIPCICGFGPLGGNAHGVDEYVNVGESLSETIDIYENIILQAVQEAAAAAAAAAAAKSMK